jgi:hypothetical protein
MMTGGDFVYMNDLLEFAQTLESAGSSTAEDVTTAVIHSMGEEVAKLAYQYAPKDTYQLANSIEVRKGPREARVVATAPHAAYVEFGTWSHNVISPKSGTYTIRPKKPGGVCGSRARTGGPSSPRRSSTLASRLSPSWGQPTPRSSTASSERACERRCDAGGRP